jgi:hypothetical protein
MIWERKVCTSSDRVAGISASTSQEEGLRVRRSMVDDKNNVPSNVDGIKSSIDDDEAVYR